MLARLAAIWLSRDAGSWLSRLCRVRLWVGPAALAIADVLVILPVRIHPPPSPHWSALEQACDRDPTLAARLVVAAPRRERIEGGDAVALGRQVRGTLHWSLGVWPEVRQDVAAALADGHAVLIINAGRNNGGPAWASTRVRFRQPPFVLLDAEASRTNAD